MLTIISILIVYVTIINSIVLLSFLYKRKNLRKIEEDQFEFASVIVAFKNEEENLKSLIEAFQNQTLSKEKFEIILVDDHSTDNSFKLAFDLSKNLSHIKVLKNKYSASKKNALKTGIEEAQNDILIFTDADCIPHQNWLKRILENFDNETDMVYGYSPFLSLNSFTNKLCRYENIYTSILMTAADNVGFPYISFGRNFAYRKSLFKRLGGFSSIENSISGDDDLFFQLAVKNRSNIKLITDADSIVFSKCDFNFNQFFRKKSRHLSASKFYQPKIKVALGFFYLANVLLNLFILPGFLFLDLFLISLIIINWFIKGVMIKIFTNRINLNYQINNIPIMDFVYFILLVLIGIRSRFKIVHW